MSTGAGLAPTAARRAQTPGAGGARAGSDNGRGGAARQKAPAGGPESREGDGDEVVRVESNLVLIPASVSDGAGRAVTDLKAEDFELRVDGEVQRVNDLARSETPVNIALLFDNSASLSAARGFEKKAAVHFFRAVMRPSDRAAVYSVSTAPGLAQPLTNDVARLVSTIERFGQPDGATALFDAIAQAADHLRDVAGRKVLVLVSDGTDTVSDTTYEEAVGRALRADCQVYVVQTGEVEETRVRNRLSEQRMLGLSEQTGGAVFTPRTVEDLDAAFTRIAQDLSQQYVLSYYQPQGRADGGFRVIALAVKARPDLRVRARRGFYTRAMGPHRPVSTTTP